MVSPGAAAVTQAPGLQNPLAGIVPGRRHRQFFVLGMAAAGLLPKLSRMIDQAVRCATARE